MRWDGIAAHFQNRSDVQCQQRWAKVVNPELVKGPWTKEVMFFKNSKIQELIQGKRILFLAKFENFYGTDYEETDFYQKA